MLIAVVVVVVLMWCFVFWCGEVWCGGCGVVWWSRCVGWNGESSVGLCELVVECDEV